MTNLVPRGVEFSASRSREGRARQGDRRLGLGRKGEADGRAALVAVHGFDASTVRFNLAATFAPLLAVLTDRAGMIVSPKAAEGAGDKFGARPVCS